MWFVDTLFDLGYIALGFKNMNIQILRDLGHDVVVTGELGYGRKTDIELLDFAQKDNRILITRDRDFGSLVFVLHAGSWGHLSSDPSFEPVCCAPGVGTYLRHLFRA